MASLKASSEPLPSPLASSSCACEIFIAYASASAARAALAAAGLKGGVELVGRGLGSVLRTTAGCPGGCSTYSHTAYAPRLSADSKSNTEIARPLRDSGRSEATGAAPELSSGSGAGAGAGLGGLGGARSVIGPLTGPWASFAINSSNHVALVVARQGHRSRRAAGTEQRLGQSVRELARRLVALVRIAIERTREPSVEASRQIGPQLARFWQRRAGDLGQNHGHALFDVPHRLRGQALVHDAAERPQIRAVVDLTLALGLLRAHVRGRAEQRTFARQAHGLCVGCGRLVELRQTEIHDLDDQPALFVLGQEDVFRLQIAMHHVRFVSFGQAARRCGSRCVRWSRRRSVARESSDRKGSRLRAAPSPKMAAPRTCPSRTRRRCMGCGWRRLRAPRE